MGKPPPLAVRLEKALPFQRWVAARASCGGAPRPRPRPNPKHNAESGGQEAHHTMRKSAKRSRGATYASQPQEGCPLLHPLQGASCLSTPLQGGILKPPALRVVDDFIQSESRKSGLLAIPLTGNLAFWIEYCEGTTYGACDWSRVSEGRSGEVHLCATDRARVRPRRLGRKNCGPRRVTGHKFRLACPSAPAADAAERRRRTVWHC